MLHRVSTKKLRFRNRVNDFYRGYRIYGVRASMAGEALSPITMSEGEEYLRGPGV